MNPFFSKKIHSFFIILLIFSNNYTFLIFLPRNFIRGPKRHFKEIIPFDKHSTANLPPLANLRKLKFLFEKPIYLLKPKFWRNWEIVRFESHYTVNLQQLHEKKITLRKVNEHPERNLPTLGTKTHPFEWMIFFSYYIIWRKIINFFQYSPFTVKFKSSIRVVWLRCFFSYEIPHLYT